MKKQTTKNNHPKTLKGFSFLEVMVVIGIIGTMSSIVMVSLWGNRNQKQVEVEARKAVSVIKEAQSNALTGRVMTSGQIPCSYAVEFGLTEYSIKYSYKDNAGELICNLEDIYGTYGLENGVESGNSGAELIFVVPFASLGSDYGLTFSKGGYSYDICVCGSGKVVEGGTCQDC